jgi:predicted Zn-dependent protease with MMP-like domain
MDLIDFEEVVAEALDALPDELRRQMNNVDVVVQDWPSPETLRQAGVRHRSGLLGFYHGVPLTERTSGYYLVLPDKISIYRMPILRHARTPQEVRETIQRVVHHEVAHHFGIDDDHLHEIGAY